ncbi:hypothetical protein Pd630_LPD10044 (plasmid) [Rhodococcus opacus PD630]|nr:hypothetical protein Pd630_LPD10044 [Rhodococcus opacus PD630]
MAATKKAGGASAQKAAADYRAALVDNSIEELVGDLAVKMGEWTQSRELRESETAKLIAAEVKKPSPKRIIRYTGTTNFSAHERGGS